MQPEREHRDLILTESEGRRIVLAPRVIVLAGDGSFPLVQYKDTEWLGLPGGKVKEVEALESVNFLSTGSFPTLVREVQEECGIDIGEDLYSKSACLGLAEVAIVDAVGQSITMSYSPIYIYAKEEIEGVSDQVKIANIKDKLPGPLFPDARAGLNRLKHGIRGEKGQINPIFLNDKGVFYFEMRPQMRLLSGPPEWM